MTQAAIALEIEHIERVQAEQSGQNGAHMTLAPSTRGMGPNTYLGMSYFWAMVLAAMIIHMTILVISGLLPKEKVTDIPVRALSFKLGDHDKIAAYGTLQGVGQTLTAASSTLNAPAVQFQPAAQPMIEPIVKKPEIKKTIAQTTPQQTQIEPEIRKVPVENSPQTLSENLPVQPQTEQNNYQPALTPPVIPQTITSNATIENPAPPAPQPAIAATPQRYIRETGLPSLDAITREDPLVKGALGTGNTGFGVPEGALGGVGVENSITPGSAEAIRARYEQEISVWIERHKLYPADAGRASGRVVLRVRVDRQGYVRYYAIEQSSNNPALDRAAIEMIRRANPVPAAPINYPSDTLIEFLIPIQFVAP